MLKRGNSFFREMIITKKVPETSYFVLSHDYIGNNSPLNRTINAKIVPTGSLFDQV